MMGRLRDAPESAAAEHEYLPYTVYPLLQEGVHELPLVRLDVHVPKAPFVGAVSLHGSGLHSKVLV